MPNWCANRLRVTGLAENVSKVRALMRGEVRPLWARAEGQGIQLFLAGCAGLLRPVTDDTYAPSPAKERLATRKVWTVPLMQALYDWVQQHMATLSRHSDTAKAFAYLLKQWDALNLYCGNGWVEIDNNIAENALRTVALGRKNWLFAGSDAGGERAAVLYSLIGTCRLNGMDAEAWLRYVLSHIQDWPANRIHNLLPWKVPLTASC